MVFLASRLLLFFKWKKKKKKERMIVIKYDISHIVGLVAALFVV